MRRFWSKDESSELETRLRSERPAADDDFVTRLAAGVPEPEPAQRSKPRVRLGLAGALTGAALTAAVVLGGVVSPVGPIGDGLEQAASAVGATDGPDKNKGKGNDKPANSQYEEKQTICHRAKKGEKGITLTLPASGAQNHLQNHPDDTPGPCPS
jgi:hypothetical protein